MRRHLTPIAIDFGRRRVKVLQLDRRGDRVWVHAAASHPVAPSTTAEEHDADLIAAGQRALRSASFRARSAVVALSLDEVATRHVRVPGEQLEDAGAHIASYLQGPATAPLATGGALSICPLPVTDVLDQGERKREFLCCIADDAAIARRIALTEGVGLVPARIDLAPVAQVRALLRRSPNDSFVLVDFGTDSTRIAVVRGGQLVSLRGVGVGAERLRTVLEKRLKIDVATLIELAVSTLDDSNQLADVVTDTIAEPLERILQRVAAGIRYCGSLFQGRAVTSIRVAGPMAWLPGLLPYIGNRVGISAEVADPFGDVEPGPLATAGNPFRMSFATALGLALGALPS